MYGQDFLPVTWYVWGTYATPQSQQRADFYDVKFIPYTLYDGYEWVIPLQHYLVPALESHLADPSPLSMEARFRLKDDRAGTLFVHIDVTDTLTTTDNVVHFLVCEDGPGKNPNLVRLVLPQADLGITEPGESVDFERPYSLEANWDPRRIALVAFVQTHDGDKRVHQAALAERGQGIVVEPEGGLAAVAGNGGVLSPSSATYTLRNVGNRAIDYSVTHSELWLSVYGSSGSIPAGGTADVTVELNDLARLLGNGYYCDVLSFENTTDHVGDETRVVSVQVGQPESSRVLSIDFESDPGWKCGLNWQRWEPLGSGGENGYPDPTSAHSGEKVFGYNMNGDYENSIPARHLTTTPFDCSELLNTRLRFWRWLGVDDATYDHASIHVSSDSLRWTTVWTNTDAVTDAEWTLVEYDISEVADSESCVYIRWTMGPTNYEDRYCGWNIDDVELWAVEATRNVSFDFPPLANYPNPARPMTTFVYELREPTHARLAVYDVSGRLVRVVDNGWREPGWRLVEWDGTNEQGTSVASGIYFSRLEAGPATATRKVVVLR